MENNYGDPFSIPLDDTTQKTGVATPVGLASEAALHGCRRSAFYPRLGLLFVSIRGHCRVG